MSTYENLRLDHQLCFALYSATHAVTRAYRGQLGELGLTYPQYLVLLALWDQPPGADRPSVKTLAKRLELDSATLTPLLKRMAAAGLVTRTRDPADERVMLIHPTDEAQALKRRLSRAQYQVACRSGLAPAEFEALRDVLHRLTETMAADCDDDPEPKR